MGVAFFFAGKFPPYSNMSSMNMTSVSGIGGLIGAPIAGALLTADYHWWRPALFAGVSPLFGKAW